MNDKEENWINNQVKFRLGEDECFNPEVSHINCSNYRVKDVIDIIISLGYNNIIDKLRYNMDDSITERKNIIRFNRLITTKKGILWPLKFYQDASCIKSIINRDSISYKEKDATFFWRGATTGPIQHNIIGLDNLDNDDINILLNKINRLHIVERCNNINKYQTDIAFYGICQEGNWSEEILNRVKKYVKHYVDIQDFYKYKYILCLEGNDVSSLLPIVLASNSVPLHSYPFSFITIIHENLQPWIHFIPFKSDGSDLEEIFEWCINNDEKCEEIANNGKEYMELYGREDLENIIFKKMLEKINNSFESNN